MSKSHNRYTLIIYTPNALLLFLVCVSWTITYWSARKQRLHLQSVVEIAAIQFCQGAGFDNVGHRLGLATRTHISVCKSPFPSAAPQCPCSVRKWFTKCTKACQQAICLTMSLWLLSIEIKLDHPPRRLRKVGGCLVVSYAKVQILL